MYHDHQNLNPRAGIWEHEIEASKHQDAVKSAREIHISGQYGSSHWRDMGKGLEKLRTQVKQFTSVILEVRVSAKKDEDSLEKFDYPRLANKWSTSRKTEGKRMTLTPIKLKPSVSRVPLVTSLNDDAISYNSSDKKFWTAFPRRLGSFQPWKNVLGPIEFNQVS